MRRPTFAALLALAALAGTLRGAPATGAPRTLAKLLPDGAAALVETDDLRALLRRWSDSALRKRFLASRAAREMEKSRLWLRLSQNLAEVEEVAGFGVTLERLTRLAGRRSAVALYDVAETSFVLVSELGEGEAARSDLLGQKGRAASREHRGVKYLLREGSGRGKAPLAVALVGERLIVGTDLEAFRGALVLAARASGMAVAAGGDPPPLAGRADFAALLAAAPAAPVRLWVAQARVAGTHYFDDYWIFGKESAAGIEAALVTLDPGDELTVETRLYQYREGARPDVVVDAAASAGRSDLVAAVAPLPPTPFASARPVDAQGAARALVELLPRGAPGDRDEAADQPIARALAAAKPRRAVETLDPSHPKGGFAEQHAALALGLGAPDALDGKALEAALAAAVAGRAARAGELAFSDEAGARVLRLPLVAEWALAWRRAGGALIVATDPASCRKLAEALAAPAAEKLLAPSGPRLWRLEVERAGATWKGVTRTLAARANWSSPDDAELFEKSVGGLFDVAKETRRVVARGYARGGLYVEEVQYRAR